jgi:hypothetical protein
MIINIGNIVPRSIPVEYNSHLRVDLGIINDGLAVGIDYDYGEIGRRKGLRLQVVLNQYKEQSSNAFHEQFLVCKFNSNCPKCNRAFPI